MKQIELRLLCPKVKVSGEANTVDEFTIISELLKLHYLVL